MRSDLGQGISIGPVSGTVKVMFSDAIIASSDRAFVLHEDGREPVYYLPFDDIYFEFLDRSQTRRDCPPKGTASYWNVSAVDDAAADVMWAYEAPAEGFDALCGYGAFSPAWVLIEFFPAAVSAAGSRG